MRGSQCVPLGGISTGLILDRSTRHTATIIHSLCGSVGSVGSQQFTRPTPLLPIQPYSSSINTVVPGPCALVSGRARDDEPILTD